MRTLRNFTLLSAMLCLLSNLNAQISEVGTGPSKMRVVRSLPNAGVKLYTEDLSGLTLYNLNLSVYRSITFPALPGGSHYFKALYITENTFDTDPATIELMMLTQDADYVSGTRVIREDGTILFDDLLFGFSGTSGYDETNAGPPLFMSEDGIAYMALTNYPTGVAPYTSKLYQLPGVLPCVGCGGMTGLVEGGQDFGGDGAALGLFPNPTTAEVSVTYTLPHGSTTALLLVHDAAGQEVARVPLTDAGQAIVDMRGHASGSYLCSLVSGGRVVRSRSLVLAP